MAEVNYSESVLNLRPEQVARELMRDCRRICGQQAALAIFLTRAGLGVLKIRIIGGGEAGMRQALGIYILPLAEKSVISQVEQQ